MRVTNNLNLDRNAVQNALLHPVTSDPSSPDDGQVWYRSDTDRLMVQANGVTETVAFASDVPPGSVVASDFDAQTILAAVTDNTPAALVVSEDTLVGRITGGDVAALSAAQIRAMLGIEAGATADQTAAEILALLLTVDGAGSGLDAEFIEGQSLASLATEVELTAAIDALRTEILGVGVGAAYDTLVELMNEIQSNDTDISTLLATQATKTGKYSADIGDGVATSIVVTHNLGSVDVIAQVRSNSTNEQVLADIQHTNSNTLTVVFAVAPATDSYRIVVVG